MNEEDLNKNIGDMTPVLLEDLGMRYSTENSKRKYRYGLYQCPYCSKEFEARVADIKSGHTKSCGCFNKKRTVEANTSHGLYKHPLYTTWNMMKARCYNPNSKRYKEYGGRGIQICDRWLEVRNFIEDMYPSWEEGLSLDRIDVNGDYELDNCRWTTQNIQSQNTRERRVNNTSGFRGVCWHNRNNIWGVQIMINNKQKYLGSFHTALEAAKAYETYVRLNNLEHNFTPVLSEEEIAELNKQREEIE